MRRFIAVAVVLITLALSSLGEAAPRRVAVMDFVNSGKDLAMEWVGPAVAETITTKLHAVRALQLVERSQLYKVLQEQKLALSDLVDPSQAVKVGKLLGAEQVVLGAYSVFGRTVRFTVRFVDVATGAIVATSQANGLLDPQNPNELWTALDQLAQGAVDSLNMRVAIVQGLPQPVPVSPAQRIEPTAEERSRLAKAPTASLAALEAFGQGQAAYKRHQWSEAARLFGQATRLDPDYSAAWNYLGIVLGNLGRYPGSLRAYEYAYQLYARIGDQLMVAGALNNIGEVHRRQGRYVEALSYFERSLWLSERLGDEPGVAMILNNIGNVHSAQGRYAKALDYFTRSLELTERLGDESGQATTLQNIGIAHRTQGRAAEALSYLERSLRLAEKLGNEPQQAKTLRSIGIVHGAQGRHAEALSSFERSLRLAEKLGDEPEVAIALHNIGNVHGAQGRHAEALSSFERSLRLVEKLGDEPGIAQTLYNIGDLYSKQGRYREALPHLERAAVIAQRLDLGDAQDFVKLRDQVRARVQ